MKQPVKCCAANLTACNGAFFVNTYPMFYVVWCVAEHCHDGRVIKDDLSVTH